MTLRGTQPMRARPRLFHFPTDTAISIARQIQYTKQRLNRHLKVLVPRNKPKEAEFMLKCKASKKKVKIW